MLEITLLRDLVGAAMVWVLRVGVKGGEAEAAGAVGDTVLVMDTLAVAMELREGVGAMVWLFRVRVKGEGKGGGEAEEEKGALPEKVGEGEGKAEKDKKALPLREGDTEGASVPVPPRETVQSMVRLLTVGVKGWDTEASVVM